MPFVSKKIIVRIQHLLEAALASGNGQLLQEFR